MAIPNSCNLDVLSKLHEVLSARIMFLLRPVIRRPNRLPDKQAHGLKKTAQEILSGRTFRRGFEIEVQIHTFV
jgi:hypothetical protein